MSAARPCRLAVLASHPIQYFTPLYRRLAAWPGLELEVFFCRDYGVRPRYDKQFDRAVQWDTDQLAGYRHRFLRNLSPITDTFNPLHAINPGAFFHLLRGFDALWVNGYLYPSNWLAAMAGALRGTRLLLRSELRLDPRRGRRRFDALRDRVIRGWIARSDAVLYIGEENRRAYRHYGAREEQLFFAPYSVDVERYAEAARRREAHRARLRAHWSIPADAVIILFVGKLTARKHPEALLRFCTSLPTRSRAHVVMAGSGPLEGQLRAEVQRRGATNVTFLGFVNQQDLPGVYALGDVFVLPSEREPWGLVLNEAMAAGLPAVVSRDVGAAADLIAHGETGYVFETGDWDAMERYVRRLIDDEPLRHRTGRAAQERSGRYAYDATVRGVIDALRALGLIDSADERAGQAAGAPRVTA